MRSLSETLLAAQQATVLEPKIKLTLSKAGEDDVVYTESRILSIPIQEEQSDSQNAEVVLDNSDSALTNLDFKGWDALLEPGLVTAIGNEYSALPPLKVISQYEPSAPGVLQCRLSLIGIPNLLAEDKASKDYFHHWSDTKKVKAMITEIADGQPVESELTEKQEEVDSYIDLKDGIHGAGQRRHISETVTKLAFRIKKTGLPTGTNVTFRIRDAETEEILASKTFPIASIGTSPAFCEVTFTTPLAVDQDVWIYCEHTEGNTSNYISVYYNSYAIKPEEWFMQVNAAGDPVTEWADRDCAYRYKYTGGGIDCFAHCQAYLVVYDSEDGLIDTYQPKDAFRIYEGQSRLDKINQLLGYTGCEKRVRADGKIHVFVPSATGSATETLRPNAAGDVAQLSAVGDTINWQMVDEETPDEGSTYVWGINADHKDLYNIANPTFPDGATINKVTMYARCRWATSYSKNGKWGIKSGETESWSAPTAFTDAWDDYKTVFNTDPNTGVAWTKAAITALQIGVRIFEASSSGMQCTQVYIEVEYKGYDSEYSLESGHTFFSKAIRKALVIPNRIVVKSLKEDENQYSGEATDPVSYALLPITGKPIRTSLVSSAQGTSIAQAKISRLQMAAQRGAASVPNNLGAEFCDYVKVTDSRQGNYRIGNLGYIRRSWKRGEVPRMDFSFGRVRIKSVPGTRPSLLPEARAVPEPTLEEAILRWGMIKPILEIIEQNFDDLWGVEGGQSLEILGEDASISGVWRKLIEIYTALGWFEGESPTSTQILLALINYYTKSQLDENIKTKRLSVSSRGIAPVGPDMFD